MRLSSDVLYHPSPPTEALLGMEPGPLGDYVFLPGRLEALKRQSLVIEAMRHVTQRRPARAGRLGPRRADASRPGAGGRPRSPGSFEIGVSDERLHQLYLGALAVHYGPFDEDYGYVTLEGFAAHRPGRHARPTPAARSSS